MHAWALMVQYGYRLLHPMNAPYSIGKLGTVYPVVMAGITSTNLRGFEHRSVRAIHTNIFRCISCYVIYKQARSVG
jgi:hypothetical protein